MEKPPNAGRGDRENRLHRNAALSAFQPPHIGIVGPGLVSRCLLGLEPIDLNRRIYDGTTCATWNRP